jgi:RNA polymerase sigma-70 factor (family 1)
LHAQPSNERDLVMLLTGGSETAFEKLYSLYSKRLLGYLIRLVKSETFACELLQDTFVKIWKNRYNINPNQSFRSYLFRIAENLVYDFFRKTARDKKLQAALINSASSEYRHVEENVCSKENAQLLQHIIDDLPPKRRQVFQLIKIEERSYAEVSVLLHISTSAINDHIVKAAKFIRKHLEDTHVMAVKSILTFFLLS